MLPAIAVIDDDASVRVAIDNLLSSHGYLVHTFASAEEFLRSTQLDEVIVRHCGRADAGHERLGPSGASPHARQ